MFCDDHDLVGGQNLHQGNDIARFLGSVDSDDSLSATFLNAVIRDVGAFAEALFGDNEQSRVALDHNHSNYGIAFAKLDSFDAGGVASHHAHVHLVESH